jgi:hypothetical protein
MKFFSFLAICSLLSIVTAFAQPKLEVTGGTTYDFGDAYSGTKVERVMTIHNAGSDTLRLSDVHAACGCTAAMMATQQIAPGDSGKLSITFNTQGYGGSKPTKQVYLTSNDPVVPKTTISFTVNVIDALVADPKFFSFDNSKMDTTYTKTITIANPSKEPIKILSVKFPLDQFKIDMMKTQLMPGEKTQLQVVYHPIKAGTYQDNIEIMTDNKAQPKFLVRVYAWVNRK